MLLRLTAKFCKTTPRMTQVLSGDISYYHLCKKKRQKWVKKFTTLSDPSGDMTLKIFYLFSYFILRSISIVKNV